MKKQHNGTENKKTAKDYGNSKNCSNCGGARREKRSSEDHE